ncbi:MAG: DNA replication protein DnaC, partial [Oscillospiraceae bacterium]|nr:DNA replication protein DnaC [Oscillospiraceae bacterium]
MSLDGKILARAKARLDERRAENERMMGRRRATAYARDPRIAEIDAQMKRTVIDAIDVALKKGADPVEALDEIRDRSLS